MTAVALILTRAADAREGAKAPIVHPIRQPVGLLAARQQCPASGTLVECRAALRRALAAVAWAKKERLHTRSLSASNLTPIEVGRELSMRRSWGGRQFACLVVLWSRESGWEPTKSNREGSGAYGIPQALPGRKMATAGADWRTNAATQIRWGLGYIAQRYGSPCAALAQSDAHGYY